MTKDQRDILVTNVENDIVGGYLLRGIEYPSYGSDFKHGVCLKITIAIGNVRYVDYYTEDGRTVDSRSWIEESNTDS